MAARKVIDHWRNTYRLIYYLGGVTVFMGLSVAPPLAELLRDNSIELGSALGALRFFLMIAFGIVYLVYGGCFLSLGLAGGFIIAEPQYQLLGFGTVLVGLIFLRFGYLVQNENSVNALRMALSVYFLDTLLVCTVYATTIEQPITLIIGQLLVRGMCLFYLYRGLETTQKLNKSNPNKLA